jgi:nicotinamide-nucleotide amidase
MSAPCIDSEIIEAARRAADAIKKAGLAVVTAESCTAGLVSAALSHADGASELLHGSFVTYTKDNKSKALGVDRKLLSEKSAVCAETAEQMACGALDRSPATLALAVTGVLGPEPDEDGNPVGLVFMAVCRKDGQPETVRKIYEKDDADVLRRRVTLDALDLLRTTAE